MALQGLRLRGPLRAPAASATRLFLLPSVPWVVSLFARTMRAAAAGAGSGMSMLNTLRSMNNERVTAPAASASTNRAPGSAWVAEIEDEVAKY